MREIHQDSRRVIDAPRMHENLREDGEVLLNRIARLMRRSGFKTSRVGRSSAFAGQPLAA
ncbi:transposase [Pseudomonas sp. SK2]|nr:transposase [Pseudomonas sp. SK2]